MKKVTYTYLNSVIRLMAVMMAFLPLENLRADKSSASSHAPAAKVSEPYVHGLTKEEQQDLSSRLHAIAKSKGVRVDGEVFVVAVRGWLHPENHRAEYDDLFCVFWPARGFKFYRGNTDPSIYRQGVATLALGHWRYKPGIHTPPGPGRKGYAAFRQRDAIFAHRDGQKELSRVGSSINLHSGGLSGRARSDGAGDSTSSLGCQTLPAEDWVSFRSLLTDRLARNQQPDFSYLLIDKAAL